MSYTRATVAVNPRKYCSSALLLIAIFCIPFETVNGLSKMKRFFTLVICLDILTDGNLAVIFAVGTMFAMRTRPGLGDLESTAVLLKLATCWDCGG